MDKEKEDKEWIERLYGPICTEQRPVMFATVPVLKGMAVGVGFSEAEALASLRRDLSIPDKS